MLRVLHSLRCPLLLLFLATSSTVYSHLNLLKTLFAIIIFWFNCKTFLKSALRFMVILHHIVAISFLTISLYIFWIKLDALLEVPQRAGELHQFLKYYSSIAIILRVLRVSLYGIIIKLLGFRKIPLLKKFICLSICLQP